VHWVYAACVCMAVTVYLGTPHIPQRVVRERGGRDGRDHTGQKQDSAADGGFLSREYAQNPIVQERQTFERAREVLAAARQLDFRHLLYFHFRPGYPEIPAQNTRSPMRAAGAVLPADPALLIHPSVKPREGSLSSPSTAPVRSPAARLTPSCGPRPLRPSSYGPCHQRVILSTVRLAAPGLPLIVWRMGAPTGTLKSTAADGEGVPAPSTWSAPQSCGGADA